MSDRVKLVAPDMSRMFASLGAVPLESWLSEEPSGSREPSLAVHALDLVREWVMSEPWLFPELELGPWKRVGLGSSSAKTLHGFRRHALGLLLIIPSHFRAFCNRNHMSSREVLREWAQRGWLQHERGRLVKVVRVGESQPFHVLQVQDATPLVALRERRL